MQSQNRFRFDIQALRALAVVLVLVFHVWPAWLPAGYIGVDVFFVISGFLITGMLYRELERDGRIRFARFYVRRFRRLMPAASLVIGVTMVLSFWIEPGFRRIGTAMEGMASALYWQNWLLAWRATDYLAAERALGPLTHYWSLSIEEQFYLVWPLALAGAYAVARQLRWGARRTAMGLIAALSGVSLVASALMAHWGLPEGYFVTHTRIWELGLGALLALSPLPAMRQALARALAVVSLLVIAACAVWIPREVDFPGLIGLIPTLSAAVFIYAGAQLTGDARFGWLAWRPIQAVGDASYSIYLWHWPLVYFATLYREPAPSLELGLGLIAASLLAGWLSKVYVEDTFRYRRAGVVPRPVAQTATATGLALSVAMAGTLYAHSRATIDAWQGLTPGGDYPGAQVLTGDADRPPPRSAKPPLAAVKEDMPAIYDNDCHTSLRIVEPKPCVLHEAAKHRPLIVLTGDSHAANWVPALRAAAEQADWRLVSITKAGCSITYDPPSDAVRAPADCVGWSEAAVRKLRELAPDVVLLGRSRRGSDYVDEASGEWVKGLVPMLQNVLTDLKAAAGRVAVIRDTPRLPFDPPNCLADENECKASLAASRDGPDALLRAARATPGVGVVDLRRFICPQGRCPGVIGNVVVWRDNHHFTATFSRSLAPSIKRRVVALLEGRSSQSEARSVSP